MFQIDEAAEATLNFTVYAPSSYIVQLTVNEADETQTVLLEKVQSRNDSYSLSSLSMFDILGAPGSLEIADTSEGSFLQSNGREIMSIGSNIDHLHFLDEDIFRYSDNTIYDSHGYSLLRNLSTLFFCDGYTVYVFHSHKKNPIHGRGVLFINRGMDVAVYFATPNITAPNLFTEVILQLEDAVHSDGSASDGSAGEDKSPGKDGRLHPDMPEETEQEDHLASGNLGINQIYDYSSSGDSKIESQTEGGQNEGSGRFARSSPNDQGASSGNSSLVRTNDELESSPSDGSGIRFERSTEDFSGEFPIDRQKRSGTRLRRSPEDHSGDSGLLPINTVGSGGRFRRSEEHSGDSQILPNSNQMVEGSGVRFRREDRSSSSGDSRLSPIDNNEVEDGSARHVRSAATQEPASGDSLLQELSTALAPPVQNDGSGRAL